MKVDKMAYFLREIERCWGDEVFCLFIPKNEREYYEVLCEYNHANGTLYIYHPTDEEGLVGLREWEWNKHSVYRLYMVLHRWGLL